MTNQAQRYSIVFLRSVLLAVASFTLLLLMVAIDVGNEELALNLLVPSSLLPISTWLVVHGAPLTLWTIALNSALLIALALIAVAKDRWRFTSYSRLLVAVAFAFIGQGVLLINWVKAGCSFYALASLCVIFTPRVYLKAASEKMSDRSAPLFFVLLFCFALVCRLLALNGVPPTFEGELSPYMLASAHPSSWTLANGGINGPWAPLGLLYYPPNYLGILLLGTTPEAIRLGSVIVFMLTLPLFYLVAVRILPSREGVLFATIAFVLDPLFFGWSRTDVHPHHVTLWITLLLIYLTLEALERPRAAVFLSLAGVMSLSWHQYPSGQSAVLIPLLPFAAKLIGDKAYRGAIRYSPLLLLGIVGWGLGHSVETYLATGELKFTNIFSLTTARTAWGSADEQGGWEVFSYVVVKVVVHLWHLLKGVFWEIPYHFHQEIIPTVPGFTLRSVSWFIAPLFALSTLSLFKLRDGRALILLWSLLVALAPALLSSQAYVKRGATAFPLIILCSGFLVAIVKRSTDANVGGRWSGMGKTAFAAQIALYVVGMPALWRLHAPGRPYEMELRNEILASLSSGTAVVGIVPTGYMRGKLAYLLLHELEETQDVMWYGCDHISCIERAYLTVEEMLPLLPTTFEYRWSRIRMVDPQEIKRVLYLLDEGLPLDKSKLAGGKCRMLEQKVIERKEGEDPSIEMVLCAVEN